MIVEFGTFVLVLALALSVLQTALSGVGRWRRSPVLAGAGEGAALASGTSFLGIGTDIGGSIRFPAAFCGVAGLKPTNHRWANLGSNTLIRGQEAIRGQIGPMARRVDDLDLFKVVIQLGCYRLQEKRRY